MDIKPQNFFIGVVDFFSVWLPGAILTWCLVIMYYNPGIEKTLRISDNETVRIIFFLFATYVIGSILFGFSSLLDILYDKKLRTLFKTKDRDDFKLEVNTAAAIRNTFIDTDEWIAKHLQSGELTNAQVKKLYAKEYRYIINTYKWSQHYLLFKNPDALADVKRLEADSKFFRSLVLTFLIISAMLVISRNQTIMTTQFRIIAAVSFFVFSLISLYLFSTFRYKSTIRAYELVIAHYYLQVPASAQPGTKKAVSSSVIKSELSASFIEENKKLLDHLMTGVPGAAKQVTVRKGELQNTFFNADKNEWWYCLEGKGMITIKQDDTDTLYFFQSNAILPVKKGNNYSFSNTREEPIELLVIN